MKRRLSLIPEGGALILAIGVLLLVMLSIAGVLSVSVAQRERIQKGLYRDFAEMEARSLLLNLKSGVVSQINKTGAFDVSLWSPNLSELSLSSTSNGPASVFNRSIQWTGSTSGSAHPELRANSTSSTTTGLLQGLAYRPVASFSFVGRWEPRVSNIKHARAQGAWEVSTAISVVQVPLSSFTYYSSALQTVVGNAQNDLGRVHAEGDLVVAAPVDAIAPVSAAGSIHTNQGGVLLVQKGSISETRAFDSSMKAQDYQAQGYGWIFEHDSTPAKVVRPVTTLELFSKTPISPPDKEKQRLKPMCDLRISHSLDASGADVFVWDLNSGAIPSSELLSVLLRNGNALEFDFSKWPQEEAWLSKIWIETNQPGISAVVVKNAESLRGDLSLATPLNIQTTGSFNIVAPIKKASLMTLGRVVSAP